MHVPAANLQLPDRAAAADRLREAVDRNGGPKQVSDHSEVALGTLNGYLAGGEIKLSNLVRLARATGASVEWLATGGGVEPPWRRKPAVNTGMSSEPQRPLVAPKIDAHWLAKAIEIVEALGGSNLPLRERAARIARSYELLTAPDTDLPPLPGVPRRAP